MRKRQKNRKVVESCLGKLQGLPYNSNEAEMRQKNKKNSANDEYSHSDTEKLYCYQMFPRKNHTTNMEAQRVGL